VLLTLRELEIASDFAAVRFGATRTMQVQIEGIRCVGPKGFARKRGWQCRAAEL
jgi:hypothetical protein